MERGTFNRIFKEHGVTGLVAHRNNLIKQLDLDPNNEDIRQELNDTVLMHQSWKRMNA
jgi:hypothetical protein